MMKRGKNIRGTTLIEMMVVGIMAAIILLGIIPLIRKGSEFFKRSSVRQQVLQDSRVILDRITQIMSNGKSRTLVISESVGAVGVPYSRVDFVLQTPLPSGTTAYAFYLENKTVYGEEFSPAGKRKTQLGTSVTGLHFTGDALDPMVITVGLRIDAPWDSTKDPSRVSTLIIPSHRVHMVDTP